MPAQKRNRNARTRPTRTNVTRADRERQALLMRQSGATFDEIAKALGMNLATGEPSRSSARALVLRALDRTVREPADEVRELEIQRLDALQRAVWERALTGDDKAIKSVLDIMDRRARFTGIAAAVQVTVTRDTAAIAAAEAAALDAARFLAGDDGDDTDG